MATAKKTKKKTAKKKKASSGEQVLEFTYTLAELPSSQHRAGLAGLWFMVDWLRTKSSRDEPGICEITDLSAQGLTLKINRLGLEQLFDQVYGADEEARAYPSPWKNREPLEVTEIKVEKKGKITTKKQYLYPVTIPRGAFLVKWDRSADEGGKGPWIKLWRDMVWSILRGRPAQRKPFQAQAKGKPSKEAAETWKALTKKGDALVDLPSTYFLGAQAATAEHVAFTDRARNQLLLQFWPFVAQIYVPVTVDNEGKHNHQGYAFAVPDVANLEFFVEDLPEALAIRSSGDESEIVGYRPKGCLVDLSTEAALDLFLKLKERLAGREAARNTSDLVLGIDVFHMRKDGNNVRMLGVGRVEPVESMIDQYSRIRGRYWNHTFRRQRLKNLLAGAPWHAGFGPIFSTHPWSLTIGDKYFKHDVRKAFEVSKMNAENTDNSPPCLEMILYQMVGAYISRKVKSKHDLDYEEAKKKGELDTYNKAREKVARDAFLASRSRTGGDFVDFFTSTICSIPQHIKKEEYAVIARALLDPDQIDAIRTLTMLALSARG
ncbi:MAG TPA: type I-MYXAN CRISPR-associated protein Cmx8 [Nannocystis exedens]|nr:type I-MYXAN CRISPR-associated protein Cmx8 [Nannocystis exedens]